MFKVLRDAEQAQLLAAIDVAVSRCIDAFNIAAETEDEDLTTEARACVERLKATATSPPRSRREPHGGCGRVLRAAIH